MPIEIWPILRLLIVAAIMLAAMCSPDRPKKGHIAESDEREEIYDAEYDQLD